MYKYKEKVQKLVKRDNIENNPLIVSNSVFIQWESKVSIHFIKNEVLNLNEVAWFVVCYERVITVRKSQRNKKFLKKY